jgi:hypothetical protein
MVSLRIRRSAKNQNSRSACNTTTCGDDRGIIAPLFDIVKFHIEERTDATRLRTTQTRPRQEKVFMQESHDTARISPILA